MTLKKGGLSFNHRHATDRQSFLNELTNTTPDIILSDYELPAFTGDEAFLKMKELGLNLPFILISGSLSDTLAAQLQELGIEDYILKDRLARLPIAVKKALKKKQIESEAKSLSDKVWKYKNRLSILHEVSPIGIFRVNEKGSYSYVNKKWCQISKVEKGNAIGNNWLRTIHPDDKKKISTAWQAYIADKKRTHSQFDFRLVHPDGTVIWVLCAFAKETTQVGDEVSYIGSIIDITENTLIRQELEENTMRFKVATEAAKTAVCELNLDTNEFVSFGFEKILGYELGETSNSLDFYLGQAHADELPSIKQKLTELALGKSTSYSDEYRFKCKDGSYKWFMIKAKVTKVTENDTRLLGTVTDINEQKKVQQELHKSKERLKQLLDNAYDEIFIINPANAKLIEVNNSVVQNTGFSKEELVGGPISKISQVKQEKLGKVISNLKKTGRISFDSIHLKKNGDTYPLEITARLINIDGEDYILAFGRDVSEKKNAEREIKKLSIVASEIDNGVVITNKEGQIDWVNKAFERMSGFPLKEVKGKYPSELFGDDDPEANQAIMDGLMTGKPFTVEMFHYTKDRKDSLWIALTITPLSIDQGGMEGAIGISTDITDRKKAELAIKESEAMFRTVLSQAPMTVIITDEQGKISFSNHQAEKLFGYNQQGLLKQNLESLVDISVGRNKKKSAKVFSNLNIAYLGKGDETLARRKDGTEFPIEASVTPFSVAGEHGFILMLKDITVQKQEEEEEQHFKIMLEQKVEERTKELNRINKLLEKEAENRKKISDALEQKNQDITSSIVYAEKLQNAMLPSQRVIERSFKESFAINMPKDIVSGDFYWFHKTRQKVMIACADCTGHGVPGAFMSMMGVELLNRVVVEQEWKFPSLVLELLDEGIIGAFKQGNVAISDGMDLSFCVIDKAEGKIQFGGAMHSIVLVSDGEINIYKGSRFGLGGYMDSGLKRFETTEIDYKEGDMLYMFSDGFSDQFGGPENRKLMGKKMQAWLLEVSGMPANKQQEELVKRHERWRGDNEQVDDILLLGIRL